MFRKALIILLITAVSISSLFAVPSDKHSDDLMDSIYPIAYGRDRFEQRILERTKGEREPVGLVLSGGSARAFAHIGVIRYLEENNIEPDYIVSNSMGTIIAMMYASGMTSDQMLRLCTDVSITSLFELILPLHGGIIENSCFAQLLQSFIGDRTRIEELDIPLLVTCEDLVTKRQVQIMEGDFKTVLNAAYALPVYFAPVHYNGHVLIDGGITSLVPLDIAYEYSDNVILSTTFYAPDNLDVENPITVINIGYDLGKRRQAVGDLNRHMDEVAWIRCPVEDYSFMQFDAAEEMAIKGYNAAAEAAEDIARVTEKHAVPTGSVDDRVISKQIDDYLIFDHMPAADPLSFFSTTFESKENEYDKMAASWKFAYRNIDLSISLGGAFSLHTPSSTFILPYLGFDFNAYPAPWMRMRFTADTNLMTLFSHPDAYTSFSIETRFNPAEWIQLRPETSYEILYRKGELSQAFGLSFRSLIDTEVFDFDARTGYSFHGSFSDIDHYADMDAEIDVHIPVIDIFTALSVDSSFALDSQKLPTYIAKSFRSSHRNVNSAYAVLAGLKIGYRPLSFSPTFGEMIILKDSEIAAWSQMLFDGGDIRWSAGGEISTNISLIGIVEFPFTFYMGYDSTTDGFISGMYFTFSL